MVAAPFLFVRGNRLGFRLEQLSGSLGLLPATEPCLGDRGEEESLPFRKITLAVNLRGFRLL
jgi:hypothetical protein